MAPLIVRGAVAFYMRLRGYKNRLNIEFNLFFVKCSPVFSKGPYKSSPNLSISSIVLIQTKIYNVLE